MKKYAMLALALGSMFLFADMAAAQTVTPVNAEGAGTGFRFVSTPVAAGGIGAALAIIGAGLGFGKIGAAALESMARQPEVAGRIFTAMLIIGAFLEGATLFALIVCIIAVNK